MSYENVPKNLTEKAVLTRGGRPDYTKLEAAGFPTPTFDEAGAKLENTDTGNRYRWSGTTWIKVENIGFPVPIHVSNRNEVGVATFVQDQTAESLDIPFLNDRGTFTTDGDTTRDTRFFDAVAGHSIVAGELIELTDATSFMQARVLGVIADAIEIDTPINHVYLSGSTGTRSSDDMRVDGSVTPVVFSVLPLVGQSGDMTRLIISIESGTAMDYTKFGSLSALTNGVVIRVKRAGGDFKNQINFKTNGEFIEKAYDNIFQSKSGGGGFGFVSRLTYAGQSKHGVVVRVDGDIGEEWQVVIQDDLSTGLTKLRVFAAGHEVE